MAKGGSGFEKRLDAAMPKDAPPNGDALTDDDNTGDVPVGPRRRVSEMRAKLHRWAAGDPARRFDALFPNPGSRLPEQTHGRSHGEPVAWRHARRVRRAAWGNDQQQCRHRAPGRLHRDGHATPLRRRRRLTPEEGPIAVAHSRFACLDHRAARLWLVVCLAGGHDGGMSVAGAFAAGVPYLRMGHGPPLLMASGLTSEHKNPTGRWRTMAEKYVAPFAQHFTVYLANRRPGLAPGTTMANMAADYAAALEDDIAQPAFVHGTSTGGSLALQLAVDHPHLVRRMVVSAAACRLGDEGRRLQAEMLRLTEAGAYRGVGSLLVGSLAPAPLRYPARGIGWLAGGVFATDDPSDSRRHAERSGGHFPREEPHVRRRLGRARRRRAGLPPRLNQRHQTR